MNPYEQFRTPFRETQWALIVAAHRFIPTQKPVPQGWNSPLGTQPAAIRIDAPGKLISDLERIWDVPEAQLLRQMIVQLGHEAPLVRAAACRTLGRRWR